MSCSEGLFVASSLSTECAPLHSVMQLDFYLADSLPDLEFPVNTASLGLTEQTPNDSAMSVRGHFDDR